MAQEERKPEQELEARVLLEVKQCLDQLKKELEKQAPPYKVEERKG